MAAASLNTIVRANVEAIKNFEVEYPKIIEGLRKSLVFKETVFVGVCAFTFEKEAAITEG